MTRLRSHHMGGSLIFSILLHLMLLYGALLYYSLVSSGGGSALGMGEGYEVLFQLAKGEGEDESADLARSEEEADDPMMEELPVEEPEEVEPEPVEEDLPEEETEEVAEDPQDEPVEEAQIEEQVSEDALIQVMDVAETTEETMTASAVASAAAPAAPVDGGTKNPGKGSQGEAGAYYENRKGDDMSGVDIGDAFGGKRLHLTMGRVDMPGGNKLQDTIIDIYPDGTSRVQLTYRHYMFEHKMGEKFRYFKGAGKWWVEGDFFCHSAKIIDYGTKDCYHMTEDEDGKFRMYYRKCTARSSFNCKTGRIAANGRVEGKAQ